RCARRGGGGSTPHLRGHGAPGYGARGRLPDAPSAATDPRRGGEGAQSSRRRAERRADGARGRRYRTNKEHSMNPRHAFSLLITGAAAAAVVAGGPSTSAQGPGGFGSRPELEIADRFDANGDDRLDAVERAAARAFVESQAGPGGGFGGRGRGGMAAGTPGPRVDSSAVRPVPASVPFYDPGTVRTLFFEIDSSDWEAELMAFKSTDVEVPAVMAVDGRRYEDVGLSFRGNSSFSMVPAGLKHSLNVSVDFVH